MSPLRGKDIADLVGRAMLVAAFGMLATIKIIGITSSVRKVEVDSLEVATHVANLAFVLLVVCMAIIRLKPVRGSEGWESRLSALAGSFLPLLHLALPDSDTGPVVRLIGLGMVVVGWVLSTYVLTWLGRSFSIMPQARRLVTAGPYGFVRHPLYLAEEFAVLGVVLIHLSFAAVGLAAVHWLFQLRRMKNEEKVLLAIFPEYTVYSESTPRVIPKVFSNNYGKKINRNAAGTKL